MKLGTIDLFLIKKYWELKLRNDGLCFVININNQVITTKLKRRKEW
jgi:hypothetical protein